MTFIRGVCKQLWPPKEFTGSLLKQIFNPENASVHHVNMGDGALGLEFAVSTVLSEGQPTTSSASMVSSMARLFSEALSMQCDCSLPI